MIRYKKRLATLSRVPKQEAVKEFVLTLEPFDKMGPASIHSQTALPEEVHRAVPIDALALQPLGTWLRWTLYGDISTSGGLTVTCRIRWGNAGPILLAFPEGTSPSISFATWRLEATMILGDLVGGLYEMLSFGTLLWTAGASAFDGLTIESAVGVDISSNLDLQFTGQLSAGGATLRTLGGLLELF